MVTKRNYLEHTSPLFKRLNLIKLEDVFRMQTALFVYKFVNSLYSNDTGFQLMNHNVSTKGAGVTIRIHLPDAKL